MRQVDGIFGEQRSGAWDDQFRWHPELGRGPEGNIRTWGQLGLKGEWADKPIQVYGYPVTNYSPLPGPMLFFRKQAFAGADMWNPNLREYPRGDQITAALDQDRYGIAYASLAEQGPGIKPVALAAGDGQDFVALTRENVASRKYPLSRSVYISVEPGQLADPKVWEFLCYVLSREGQKVVQREGGYLPLTTDEALIQLRKLTAARSAATSDQSN
jgi:phosphate transport system substrate-binding protein